MKRVKKFTYSVSTAAVAARSNESNRTSSSMSTAGNSAKDGSTVGGSSQGPHHNLTRKRPRSPPIKSNSLRVKACKMTDGKFDDEVDELDVIGTAALEQYESTQRESFSQNSVLMDCILEPNSIPKSIQAQHSVGVDHKFSLGNRNEERSQILNLNFPPEEAHNPEFTKSKQSCTVSSAVAAVASANPSNNLEEKVLYLQEQNYTKDGEVKVLRGEIERLRGELKKKSEQLDHVQARLLSDERAIEWAAAKEKESSLTKLQFKQQEMRSLQEKYAELEQMYQQQQFSLPSNANLSSFPRMPTKSQPLRTSSRVTTKKHQMRGSSTDHVSTSSQNKTTEFLSTETFMPLSQLNPGGAGSIGGLVTVPVESSRLASKTHQQQPKGSTKRGYTRKGCGQIKTGGARSRSISPNPSDMKILKRKSRSGDDLGGRFEERFEPELDGIYALQSDPTTCGGSPHLPPPSLPKVEKKELPLVLSVPERELDGAKILMLLCKGNLHKPPVSAPFSSQQMDQKPYHLDGCAASSGGSQPSQLQPQNEVLGFLSLISYASKQHPSFGSSLGIVTQSTPVFTPLHRPASPASSLLPSNFPLEFSPSSMRTPSRKQRLLPAKPHTLARTNLAQGRIRHSSGLLMSSRMKSNSATNSPIRAPPLLLRHQHSSSGSLISSISAQSLHSSMSELLAASEISQFAFQSLHYPSTRMCKRDREKVGRHCSKGHQNLNRILLYVGMLIVNYHREQIQEIRSLQNSAFTSSCSEGGSECLDASLIISPMSSSKASSFSELSSSSSSSFTPMAGNQQLLTSSLNTLEVLVIYSKEVREQILLEPPEFMIDSRPSSSLGMHQNNPLSSSSSNIESASPSEDGDKMDAEEEGEITERRGGGEGVSVKVVGEVSTLARVSHRLVALLDPDTEQEVMNGASKECGSQDQDVTKWKDYEILRWNKTYPDLSDRMWVKCSSNESNINSISHLLLQRHKESVCSPSGSGCGKLFPVLLDLLSCPWVESCENILVCVKVLICLAKDCSMESLFQFGQLLEKDAIALCLEKEYLPLTSSILSLLTLMVLSEKLIDNICDHGEPCILLTFYQYLLEPLNIPSPDSRNTGAEEVRGGGGKGGESDEGGGGKEDCVIQTQIVALVSRIVVSDNGQLALFEKCSCAHELLRSLVSLLDRLVDHVYQLSQWSQKQLTLVLEVIALVYRISISDHYFDTHRESCEQVYTFVFNRLSLLLQSSAQPYQEVRMVSELLTYCEELDDSLHESSQEEAT